MTSEKIQLGMLIIQVLTLGGLIWYAWETRKMRLRMSRQTDLLEKSVEATVEALELQKTIGRNNSDLILQWLNDGWQSRRTDRPNKIFLQWENDGALVFHLTVKVLEATKEVQIDFQPQTIFRSKEEGGILLTFDGEREIGIRFQISYVTCLGDVYCQTFQYTYGKGLPVLIERKRIEGVKGTPDDFSMYIP